LNKRWSAARRKQSGSSTLQLLSYLLAGWLVLTALLRLAPIYLEHRAVISVMDTIVDQYDPSIDSKARIKQKLDAAWSLNAIDQADSGSVRVERRRSGLTLMLQYEVRFPIVGDIVGVWAFDETFSTP